MTLIYRQPSCFCEVPEPMGRIIIPEGWQGITRIDQRVICVEQLAAACSQIRTLPVVGIIYRVAGFGCIEKSGDGPGIFLREIEAAFCTCFQAKVPFPIVSFRPVGPVEKKFSAITEMLDQFKIDTRVPEDA